jgi:hypothetical protein
MKGKKRRDIGQSASVAPSGSRRQSRQRFLKRVGDSSV